MRDEFVDLRSSIYQTEKELRRFRQTIVNCCLSTDLFDADLQTLRKARWAKAFSHCGTAVATIQQTKRRPGRMNSKGADTARRRASDREEHAGAMDEERNNMIAALRRVASQDGRSIDPGLPKDDVNRKATIVLEHLIQVRLF